MQRRVAAQRRDGDAVGGGDGTGQFDAAACNLDVGARDVPAGGFNRDTGRSRNLAAEIDVVGGNRYRGCGIEGGDGGDAGGGDVYAAGRSGQHCVGRDVAACSGNADGAGRERTGTCALGDIDARSLRDEARCRSDVGVGNPDLLGGAARSVGCAVNEVATAQDDDVTGAFPHIRRLDDTVHVDEGAAADACRRNDDVGAGNCAGIADGDCFGVRRGVVDHRCFDDEVGDEEFVERLGMVAVRRALDLREAETEAVGAAEQHVAVTGCERSRILDQGSHKGEQTTAGDRSRIAHLGGVVTPRGKGKAAGILDICDGEKVAGVDIGAGRKQAADVDRRTRTEGDTGWIDDPDMALGRQHAFDCGRAEPARDPVDGDPVATALVERDGVAGADIEALPVDENALCVLVDGDVHARAIRNRAYRRRTRAEAVGIAHDDRVERFGGKTPGREGRCGNREEKGKFVAGLWAIRPHVRIPTRWKSCPTGPPYPW